MLLARAYFDYHLGGCGSEALPVDKDTHWLFATRVGYSGAPGPDILVDKRTGATSAHGLPTVANPGTYYRQARATPYWLDHGAK